jgi:uncharacterized HhH-GPD family protein
VTPAAPRLRLAQSPPADDLLSADPFALLAGMLLDQQIPMEKAFAGPYVLAQRLGSERLDPAAVASADPGDFAALMARPPAVHRYHTSMAARLQAMASHVVEVYDGDAAAIWRDAADGAELLRRLKALPGFGDQKPGSSWRCSRSSAASLLPGGRRRRGTTARPGSVPSPTSSTKTRCARSASTSRR